MSFEPYHVEVADQDIDADTPGAWERDGNPVNPPVRFAAPHGRSPERLNARIGLDRTSVTSLRKSPVSTLIETSTSPARPGIT
ncbi:hypothetical protein EKH55_4050 [Sinorhizobium alkalisoli]|nr:hypothetical protein EKH55_4050 [Sinorhizobium alkalisoli]